MKVVIVGLTTTSRGGIAHYTDLLHETFALNHHTYIVPIVRQLFRRIYKSKINQEVGEEITKKTHELPLARLDPTNPFNWFSTARKIASQKPDMVVVTWWATTYWILSIGIVVNLIHRLSPETRIIYWCHDARFRNKPKLWSLLVNYSLAQADGYLVHTKAQEQAVLSLVPTASVKVTPLPMPENRFPNDKNSKREARLRLGLPDSAQIALFFGYVASYKGLEEFINAGAIVMKTLPDFHLLIAGEFWEDPRPYLDQIKSLQLDSVSTIVDSYIADEEVQLYFQAADVLVLPYRDATQSGVAMLGFEFDLPIIATTAGGMPETLIHNESGLLFPPRDVESLARTMVGFFRNDLSDRLVQGMDKRREALSPQKFLQTFEKMYSDSLS